MKQANAASSLPWAIQQARQALDQAVTFDPEQPATLDQLLGSNARCREALATLIQHAERQETAA